MTKKYQHTKVVPLFGGRVFLLESKADGTIGPLLAHEADAELDRLHPTHAPYSICRDDKDGSAPFHVVASFEEEQPEKGYHSPAFERARSSYEQPLRDNLACAEVKLEKIDELITQVHAHLAAERAYISGEAGYYR